VILTDIPKGSSIVIETQALLVSEAYKVKNVPQLVLDSRTPGDYDGYVKAGVDYIVASSQKYGAALSRPKEFPELYDAYARLFGQSQEVMRFTPGDEHPGPEIRVFRLDRCKSAGLDAMTGPLALAPWHPLLRQMVTSARRRRPAVQSRTSVAVRSTSAGVPLRARPAGCGRRCARNADSCDR
jgi:hypothetical protein